MVADPAGVVAGTDAGLPGFPSRRGRASRRSPGRPGPGAPCLPPPAGRGFDASLRAPWLPSAGGGRTEGRPFTPTGLVSGLVRCTAWGAGVWWLATEHGWAALARTLEWAAGRVW